MRRVSPNAAEDDGLIYRITWPDGSSAIVWGIVSARIVAGPTGTIARKD